MQKPERRNAAGELLITCAQHGEEVWRFDLVCESCGARWQARDEKEPRYAPQFCTCHRLLMSRGDAGTARPICAGCARNVGAA